MSMFMAMFVDARIPVLLEGPVSPDGADAATALLLEGDAPAPSDRTVVRFDLPRTVHVAGCACCLPRGPVAEALGRLFLARARGEVPFFRRVLARPVSEAGRNALITALADDPLVSGRFRLG
jgi:hypothetical protein